MYTQFSIVLFVQRAATQSPLFHTDGVQRWERRYVWPAIPRVGDHMSISDHPEHKTIARVQRVVWNHTGYAVVHLHLRHLTQEQAIAIGATYEDWMSDDKVQP